MPFVKLKTDEHLNLEDWSLQSVDKVSEFIKKGIYLAAGEALHHTLVVDPGAHIEFKFDVDDPLIISFSIADLDSMSSYPTMYFSLRDIWDEEREQEFGEDEGYRKYVRRVAQALREFADEIETRSERGR